MTEIKRVEVIIDESHAEYVLDLLDKLGATGYTVIRQVVGKGDRGIRGGDGLTDVFSNCYILIACDETMVQSMTPKLRRMLRDYGGVCLISDALWMTH